MVKLWRCDQNDEVELVVTGYLKISVKSARISAGIVSRGRERSVENTHLDRSPAKRSRDDGAGCEAHGYAEREPVLQR